MIGVKEIGIVLMPPVGILPGAVALVVAILVEPKRVHHGPFRMIAVEPHDVVLMPASRAMPLVTVVVSAPSGLSGSAVVARAVIALVAVSWAWAVIAGAATILRERRRCHPERQDRARHDKRLSEFVFDQFDFHKKRMS